MPKRVLSASQRDRLGPSREHCVNCGEAAARTVKIEQAQVEQEKIDQAQADSEEALIVDVKIRPRFKGGLVSDDAVVYSPVGGENDEKGGIDDTSS